MSIDPKRLSDELSQLTPEKLCLVLILCVCEIIVRMVKFQAQISILNQKLAVNQHFCEQMCEGYERD